MSEPLAQLQLKSQADRRLRAGHLWIYSNEFDVDATPLKNFQPGQQLQVVNAKGKSLGLAYINPHSLICGRLISREVKYPLDKSLLVHRLNIALSLRQAITDKPFIDWCSETVTFYRAWWLIVLAILSSCRLPRLAWN